MPDAVRPAGAGATQVCAGPHLRRGRGRRRRVVTQAVTVRGAARLSAEWRQAGCPSRGGSRPFFVWAPCLTPGVDSNFQYVGRRKRPGWRLRRGARLRWRAPAAKGAQSRKATRVVVSGTCPTARGLRARRAWAAGPRRIGSPGLGRAAARRAGVRPIYRRIHDSRIKVHPIVRSGIGRYNLSYMRPSSVRSRDEKTLRLSAGTVIVQPSRRFFRPPRRSKVLPHPRGTAQVSGWPSGIGRRTGSRFPATRGRAVSAAMTPLPPWTSGVWTGANGCTQRQNTAVDRHLFRVAPVSQPAGPLVVVRRSLASLPPRRRFNLCDLPR